MLDLFNIPNTDNTRIYYSAGSGSNTWQTWNKPKGCNHVFILAHGGGGGGGAGFSRTINTATGGSA